MAYYIEKRRVRIKTPRLDAKYGTSTWVAIAPYMYVTSDAHASLLSDTPLPYFVQIYQHEKAHIQRQEAFGLPIGVHVWWAIYLYSARFRVTEELHAIRAEMLFCVKEGLAFDIVWQSKVLSSKIYGYCISEYEATKKLKILWEEVQLAHLSQRS